MRVIVRRCVVLYAFLVWQGGGLFYALVVVPTARAVHGSILPQAAVTRQVTWGLNWLGAFCLLILLWDMFADRRQIGRMGSGRYLCWLGMAASVAVLLGLHPWLDALMSREAVEIVERERFENLHAWHLAICLLQSLLGVGFVAGSLRDWRNADRGAGTAARPIALDFYTRAGCHLCDDAQHLLEEMQTSFALQINRIDIEGQPELIALHGERVPVIVLDGKPRLWGKINRVLLERLLRRARNSR